LKVDCAEADATSAQNKTTDSIRLLNLDLLFYRDNGLQPASGSHSSAAFTFVNLDALAGKGKAAFFPRRVIL
jgi:hypothetical protein